MRVGRIFVLTAALAAAVIVSLGGCDDDEVVVVPGDVGGSAGVGTATGAGGGAAALAEMRIAHLAPDVDAVDVCWRRSDQSAFVGPEVRDLLNRAGGLGYGQVTRYLRLAPGTYVVRLVAAGQASCEPALAGTVDVADVNLVAERRYTVAALGEATPADAATRPFTVKKFTDSVVASQTEARVTFIHASPDAPEIDLGVGTGADFRAVFEAVGFGERGAVAGRPFFASAPMPSATLTLRPTGTTTDALVVPGVTLRAGSVATMFAIGNVDGDPKPLALLVCNDAAPPVDELSDCTVRP